MVTVVHGDQRRSQVGPQVVHQLGPIGERETGVVGRRLGDEAVSELVSLLGVQRAQVAELQLTDLFEVVHGSRA